MTPEEIRDIDRKVAEAIGITWGISQSGIWKVSPPVPFRPSTDWNDAMFAAEKAGLFDYSFQYQPLSEYDTTIGIAPDHRTAGKVTSWRVCFLLPEKGRMRSVSMPTGPLAICAAILSLKGKA